MVVILRSLKDTLTYIDTKYAASAKYKLVRKVSRYKESWLVGRGLCARPVV